MTVEPGRADLLCAEGENMVPGCRPLQAGETFPFVCAGCGDCCRKRKDLVLSGYDLYRIARRLSLPPRIVAAAFCKRYTAPQSLLPTLCLTIDPATGNCRFLEGGGCAIHAARPLACALYPLGQTIDPVTAQVSYCAQQPLCGAAVAAGDSATLQGYLKQSGIAERVGADVRWAVVCTEISALLQTAAGANHPHLATAVRRAEKALYFDYALGDEFYPQFQQNTAVLLPLLRKILA